MKVGVFDSGIGGFSILKEIFKMLPSALLYYISDDAYSPYGSKEESIIFERCCSLSEILMAEEVDVIVVACNTATAIAIDKLRKIYDVPFIGVEPYLNILNKDLSMDIKNIRPVVLTTEATASSKRFQKLRNKLDPLCNIHLHICKKLAVIVEKAYQSGFSPELKREIQEDLAPITRKGFTHAILGCTHYPLLAGEIEEVLGVECISPCANVASQIKNVLDERNILKSLNYDCSLTQKNETCHFLFKSTLLDISWESRPKSSFFQNIIQK